MIGRQSHPPRSIAPPTVLSEPGLHPDYEAIDHEVIGYLVDTWDWPSEKAKKGFVSWKLSDVVLYMFPTGEAARVKLACELLLLGFLMDGPLAICLLLLSSNSLRLADSSFTLRQTGSTTTRLTETGPPSHVSRTCSTTSPRSCPRRPSSACTPLSFLASSPSAALPVPSRPFWPGICACLPATAMLHAARPLRFETILFSARSTSACLSVWSCCTGLRTWP